MKADPKIRRMTADAIRHHLQGLYDNVTKLVEKLESAETVECIMDLKKEILRRWIEFFPLSEATCYFCNLHDLCETCEYAEHHGCCVSENSDYAAISSALEKLMDALDNYYKGEQYDEEAEGQNAETTA